jgi:hypothetical protein
MSDRISSSRCIKCGSIRNVGNLVKNEDGRLQCEDVAWCEREKKKVAAPLSDAASVIDRSTKGREPF